MARRMMIPGGLNAMAFDGMFHAPTKSHLVLGGGFKHFILLPLLGEMIQFD